MVGFSNRHLPQGTQQILEMACGTGALAVDFAKSGYDVTALDLSEEMLMIASERAFEEEVPVQFVQGNMLDLSEVGQYQAITCFLIHCAIWLIAKKYNKCSMKFIKR